MIISGYRNMIGLTQREMADRMNISEGTYRNKEKGVASFKDYEMKTFFELVHKKQPSITFEDIFLMTNRRNKTFVKGFLNLGKLFNKLNEYFLHDSDERAALSECIIFYSFLSVSTTTLIIYTILNITF